MRRHENPGRAQEMTSSSNQRYLIISVISYQEWPLYWKKRSRLGRKYWYPKRPRLALYSWIVGSPQEREIAFKVWEYSLWLSSLFGCNSFLETTKNIGPDRIPWNMSTGCHISSFSRAQNTDAQLVRKQSRWHGSFYVLLFAKLQLHLSQGPLQSTPNPQDEWTVFRLLWL